MHTTYIDTREQVVLGALYHQGSSSISTIAKATLINRTTLYPILEKLLHKGLVTQVRMEGKVFYDAISLSELETWIERKEDEASMARSELVSWAQKQKKDAPHSLVADIKYFDGLEGVMNLYNDTWRENREKVIYALTDYEKAYAVVGNAFLRNKYFEQRVKHGVRVQSLLPDSAVGRKDVKDAQKLLREMRFIDLFEDLGIELNVYDDKVALFAFDAERPSGVLIKNKTIADAFKHIFAYLWKTGKKARG